MSLPRTRNSSFSLTNTVEIGSLFPQVCVIKRVAKCIPRAHTKLVLFTNQNQSDADTKHSCKTRHTCVQKSAVVKRVVKWCRGSDTMHSCKTRRICAKAIWRFGVKVSIEKPLSCATTFQSKPYPKLNFACCAEALWRQVSMFQLKSRFHTQLLCNLAALLIEYKKV